MSQLEVTRYKKFLAVQFPYQAHLNFPKAFMVYVTHTGGCFRSKTSLNMSLQPGFFFFDWTSLSQDSHNYQPEHKMLINSFVDFWHHMHIVLHDYIWWYEMIIAYMKNNYPQWTFKLYKLFDCLWIPPACLCIKIGFLKLIMIEKSTCLYLTVLEH